MSDRVEIQRVHDSKVITHLSPDDAEGLASTGKKQVFMRKYTFWTALAISVCATGTWEGIIAAAAQGLNSGGTSSLVYGFIAAALGALLISSSLAELASTWPTSGAIYHWIPSLCLPSWRPFMGYIIACVLYGTGFLGICSAGYGVAVQTQAYAILSYPDYVPQDWHALLIFYAALLAAIAVNIFATKLLHYVNIAVMVLHVTAYFAIIITLLVCTNPKNDAHYVFTNVTNNTGWSNNGIAWCIGLLSTVYGFVGVETAAYFSEEVQHAQRTVPRAIVACVAANGVMVFPFVVILTFCIKDLDSVLSSPVGAMSPTTMIFIQSTGNVAAGIALNATSTIVAFTSLVDALGSGSRSMFAMARDGVFPRSLAKVDPRFDVPINALLVISACPALLGLIYIGNSTAFYGFMSGVLLSMFCLYLVPIALLLYRRLHDHVFLGPWNLGRRFGPIINGGATLWLAFLIVILSLPSQRPVTKENMNYGSIMLIGTITIALAIWFLYGRHNGYSGPRVEITDGVNVSPDPDPTSPLEEDGPSDPMDRKQPKDQTRVVSP